MVLLLLLLPLVLTALIPRRWLGPWFATLLLGFALCWLDFSRVNARAGDMLGMGFLMLMLSAVLAVGAVRWALTAIFRKTPEPVADLHAVHLYYVALGGPVVAAALLVATLQVVDVWWPGALALHLGAVVAGVGWWFAIPKVWPAVWPLSAVPYRVQARTVFRMAGLVAIVGAIAWSLASSYSKADAAQQAAQGQPYCLLSGSPHGMQPVLSRLDLSGFAARASRGGDRHARMVAGTVEQPVWRYWSYRQSAWQQDPLPGVLTCPLVPNRASALPWWAPAPVGGDPMRFWMAGVAWSIPRAHLPTTDCAMPAFQYLPASANGLSPSRAALARVHVRPCGRGPIHPWYLAPSPGDQVRTLHQAYGLEQQEIVTSRRAVPHVQWILRDAAGEVTAWMQCHAASGSCHHAFKREGIAVEFTHPEAALPAWQQLEDEQWAQLRSFAPDGLPACNRTTAPAG
ncbi:YihY/virulence factor BrkB family protein [Rhodoferax bucti]|uniref:YihY/virulence factor BrkB family protein n=1 Tax=Rhodoferax bucti TaxID=2576305 RepID=UPI001108F843|nr:YihY/virulence factor BrkB family protein [Rhodoferax bucti]